MQNVLFVHQCIECWIMCAKSMMSGRRQQTFVKKSRKRKLCLNASPSALNVHKKHVFEHHFIFNHLWVHCTYLECKVNLGNSIQSSGSQLFCCLTMKFQNVGLSNVWALSWLSVANFVKTVHIPSEGSDCSEGVQRKSFLKSSAPWGWSLSEP